MQLEPILKKAIRSALSEGVNDAEVFAVRTRTLAVYVDNDAIKNMEEKTDQGLAVRVVRAKKVGQAASTFSSTRDAEACAIAAVRLAGMSRPDPDFKGFPRGEKGAEVPAVYDRAVSSIDPATLCDLAKRIVAAATEGGDVSVPSGVMRMAAVQTMVANTNGVETENRNTMIYSHFTSMAGGEQPGEGVHSFFSPNLAAFDAAGYGSELRQRALDARTALPFSGRRKMTVIMPPYHLQEMLATTVSYSVSAENVRRRRSPWVDKVGATVASPKLSIMDDPLDPRGMLSSGYDDEGVRTTRKPLIDHGVLKTLLNDSYHAGLTGTRPTGNAVRRSPVDPQNMYRNGLAIEPINLVVRSGSKSLQQVISGIDDGLLIGRIASSDVDGITGGFGFEVRCAYQISKGSIERVVNRALLAGNFYQSLGNVNEVANDAEVFQSSILPSVAFDDMEVIGEG